MTWVIILTELINVYFKFLSALISNAIHGNRNNPQKHKFWGGGISVI